MSDDEPADLTDFGGGVEHDDATPEDRDNRIISQWLTRSGSGVRVYWDREKSYGHGTFSVTTRRRPDLVIDGPANSYAVEMKRAERSTKIYDGALQAFEYWRDIETGQAEYSLDGKAVDIDAVLLASRRSAEGYLFHGRQNKDPRRSGRGKGSNRAVERGLLPETEHASSETLTRLLCRFAKREYNQSEQISGETGIGSLYSSALDGDEPGRASATPAAYYVAPGLGRVASSWQYIPFHRKPGVE